MTRVCLVHWNVEEAAARASQLEEAGYDVTREPCRRPEFLRLLGDRPAAAVIIDLSRRPSHGMAIALALRQFKATRAIPLVFADGDEEKVLRIRQILPDATYTEWRRIRRAVKEAIAHPPLSPVVPRSAFELYAGRPLALKLGIKPDTVVSLVGAPPGFDDTLGDLPAGVRLLRTPEAGVPLTVWFVRSQKELRVAIGRMAAYLTRGSLWISWPKVGSRLASDLRQQDVREIGLAEGLVDYKVCAIDETWSALLFTRRKRRRTAV